MQMLKNIPFIGWLFDYKRSDLKGDVVAGITVAVLLIPQSMAIALIAGLPPVIGLYASVVPLFLYAIFGSSNHLSVGPVAIISLLVNSAVSKLAPTGSPDFILYATILAGMIGIIHISMGLLNFGYLVNFLSHPVISGFTSAAAVIITFSQIKHILGVTIPKTDYIHQILYYSALEFHNFNWPTITIGVVSFALILYLKQKWPAFPNVLVVTFLGAFVVWLFNLETHSVKIIGELPTGLHPFSIPITDKSIFWNLLPTAVAVALVAYMESIAIAKKYAFKHNYEIDVNKELVGLGMANLGAFCFGAYAVTGGFSRSAVNESAGAKTRLASIITAGLIALTLMFLTDVLYYLPYSVLAVIIIIAVSGLFDWRQVLHLYQVKRIDLISWIITFWATLIIGVEKGLILSIIISLILVVKRTTNPHYAILGRLPRTKIYRNIERYPEAITTDGLLILRIDSSLYFANASYLKEKIKELLKNSTSPVKAIIFDASSVNDIDSSADTTLHEIAARLKRLNIEFYFTNVKGPVRDVLLRSGFYDKLGTDHFFFSNHDAVLNFLNKNKPLPNETQGNRRKVRFKK